MKKIITIAFALILMFSLAACGDNNGDNGDGFGDITVPGGSSTPGATNGNNEKAPTSGQTESQPQQPGGNIDAKLIGEWKSGAVNYKFNANGSWSAVFKVKIAGSSYMPYEEYKGSYQINGNAITYLDVEKRSLTEGTGPWQSATYDDDYYIVGKDSYYENYGDCIFITSSPINFDPFTGSEADGIYLYSKGY